MCKTVPAKVGAVFVYRVLQNESQPSGLAFVLFGYE